MHPGTGAGAIHIPVLQALLVLGKPDVGVSDDQARLRGRKRHALCKFAVEMIVPWVHLCFGDLI